MNINSGEILAMASFPDFDPTSWVGGLSTDTWNYYRDPKNHDPLVNRAVSRNICTRFNI